MTIHDSEAEIRTHLRELLAGGQAHLTFAEAIRDWPEALRGVRVPGVPHTAWRLLEHLRICQWDILEFSRNAAHVSPDFPDGYWPQSDAPPDAATWDNSVETFRSELRAMTDLVMSPATQLMQPIPHGDGQTILREALLLADHNSYHLGQLAFLRRALRSQA